MINKKCPICLSKKSKLIKTVYSFPIFQGPVNKNELKKIKIKNINIEWLQCHFCSSVYMKNIPPLKYVYFRGHATGFGDIWRKHYQNFADFLLKNTKENNTIRKYT